MIDVPRWRCPSRAVPQQQLMIRTKDEWSKYISYDEADAVHTEKFLFLKVRNVLPVVAYGM